MEADGLSKAYGSRLLFQDSSFYVSRGEKIGILGANGCGKTTLVKMILGRECIDAGTLFLSQAARIMYVSQELPRQETEALKERIEAWTRDEQKRLFQLLNALGMPYDRLHLPLGKLSRGERMKIAIGLAIIEAYDLLILDEPTNHLDIDSREALQDSLVQFPGTILLISHDRYLMDRVCERLLVFDQHRIIRSENRWSDYLAPRESPSSPLPLSVDDRDEEKLLLETRMARILGELSRCKPGDADYAALDREYRELMQRQNRMSRTE